MNFLIGTLLVFIFLREFQHQQTVQKLVDKIMSKNYYDYKISQAIPETPSQKTEEFRPVVEENDPDLDLLNAQFRV